VIMLFRNLICLGLITLISACNKSGPNVAPVHGRVTLDGQPLPNTSVVFQVPGTSQSGGYTDKDGNYELVYKRGVKGGSLGMNRVTIIEDAAANHGPQRVPARYNSESDLQREVKPGENEFDFELTTQPK